LVGASLCVLLGLVGILFDGEGDSLLRNLSYDLPIRLRGPLRPQEVLIVSMDAALQRQLNSANPNLWSRAVHARLVRQALALGAELVVFDITFNSERRDDLADQQFAEALRAGAGKVVLGVKWVKRDEDGNAHSFPLLPSSPFEEVASWGLVEMETNRDGRVRRHYVDPSGSHPSLVWKAAELLGKAPAASSSPRWMNYYGPRAILPSIPYDRFLEQPATETNRLAGRVLFVGWNPAVPDGVDEHPTPFTRYPDETLTGVQLHATAFLNLFRREWLEELPWFLECMLSVFVGAGLVWGLPRLRMQWAVACSAGCFFLLLLGACLLVWFKHRWFPWLVMGGVQVPAALFWSRLARRSDAMVSAETGNGPAMAQLRGDVAAPQRPEPRRVPQIPDHAMIRCVGRGAYGEVWLARDIIGSFHAVKVVYRKTFADDQPFEREFRGIQKFTPISRQHPGWVHILHIGRNEAEDCFYYIMELGDDESTTQSIHPDAYVPRTLAGDLEKRGPLPLAQCVLLGRALADALEHLHRHGLIHRDIKPSNVIFVRGTPKFADIGLVTEVSNPRDVSWIGTAGYMAPEGPGTPVADLFGLGKLLYEAVSGRDRGAFPQMPTAMVANPPTAAWARFQEILLKACEPDPAKRHSSAAELERELSEVQRLLGPG
jgi:CHASE2 domain-containing sensor protein